MKNERTHNKRNFKENKSKEYGNKGYRSNDNKNRGVRSKEQPKLRKETVEIKKLGINGEGIGYIDRKICFVKGALPDEEVNIEITKQNRNFYEGQIVEITKKSTDRIPSVCNLSRHCLGCSLLHMKYPLQAKYKKEAIRESIRKYTSYDLSKTVFKDVIGPSSRSGFINSISIPIVSHRGKITFGVYQRESKYLTPLTACFKHNEIINTALTKIETIFEEENCKIYNDKFKTGLRFIKVKCIQDKLQLVIITGKDNLSKSCVDKITELEEVVSLFVSVNTARHQEFDEVGYSKIYGNTRLEFDIDGNRHLVSVKSNIGENSEMTKAKVHHINRMLEDSLNVLSIHCGLGFVELQSNDNLTFTSIDEKSYHIEDAKLNAKYLYRENINFMKGDVDDKIILYAKKREHDTFLIQNERFGLSDDMKNSIRLSKVQNVIISCDSHSTLAKDLAELEEYYHLEKIVALDTFVYTPYVTTIVKLKRK